MGNPHCHWVRDRLPLLGGDELRGLDRRRVERHLIGCPTCRRHRVALDEALEVLHAAAGESPSRSDAPSLWPELARQIRESRRPAPTSSWAFDWSRLGIGLRPALGLGLAASVLAIVTAVVLGLRADKGRPAIESRPVVVAPVRPQPQAPALVTASQAPAVETPEPVRDVPKPQSDTPATDSAPPPTRMGYDLDRGRPMGPDSREGRSQLTH